jgi:hypothetical protein
MDGARDLARDLEALNGEQSQQRGPACTVGVTLSRLAGTDPPAAQALQKALEDPQIRSTRIAAVLSDHGQQVQAATVARHRRRGAPNGCRCPQ